jgi:hypothetical protein
LSLFHDFSIVVLSVKVNLIVVGNKVQTPAVTSMAREGEFPMETIQGRISQPAFYVSSDDADRRTKTWYMWILMIECRIDHHINSVQHRSRLSRMSDSVTVAKAEADSAG